MNRAQRRILVQMIARSATGQQSSALQRYGALTDSHESNVHNDRRYSQGHLHDPRSIITQETFGPHTKT